MEKYVVRKSIKHKIIEGIDADMLVHLSFAKADTAMKLDWKHSKEFAYNGEMYDIVERTYSEDSVKYALWWDNEETQLNKKLNQLASNYMNGSPEHENKSGFFGFVIKQFFYSETDTFFIAKLVEFCESQWHYLASKSEEHTFVNSPPPKHIIYNT
ncbi:MAG: hypothetical protein WED10_12910, partial [Brumimicrobium sp.]